jgi:hypothetical protein
VLETKEQRVDRNCQCQRQRLAAATPEHNHSRRHRFANSELTITIDTSIPMMENQLVIVKITEYHSYCPVIYAIKFNGKIAMYFLIIICVLNALMIQ